MGRFIIIILDGFGIGYMEDTKIVRPQDVGSNTCGNILKKMPGLKLKNLEKLGLINALNLDIGVMRKSNNAIYGRAALSHKGADTFLGHQEIMGSKPKPPVEEPFSKSIDRIFDVLTKEGYRVEYKGGKIKFLLVNGCATIADNIEADLGQVYNITTTFDLFSYNELIRLAKIVRENVKVSRIIAFGGENVSIDEILNAVEEKENKYVGINAPKSGVYKKGYRVHHFGYGINPNVQIPTILGKRGINVCLVGKVADIVSNEYGESINCVDTKEVLEITLAKIRNIKSGFICANIQETDLAGHEGNIQKYAEKLLIADEYIGYIIANMNDNDRLIVMADHGNDPTIGHSHHTREYVPLLVYGKSLSPVNLGTRDTLSDVGATVADYFNVLPTENGISFLNLIQ